MGIFSPLVMLLRGTAEDCRKRGPIMAMAGGRAMMTHNTTPPDWKVEGQHRFGERQRG
jgi:hypothetical protein